jgi:hypothetical protein
MAKAEKALGPEYPGVTAGLEILAMMCRDMNRQKTA